MKTEEQFFTVDSKKFLENIFNNFGINAEVKTLYSFEELKTLIRNNENFSAAKNFLNALFGIIVPREKDSMKKFKQEKYIKEIFFTHSS